MLSESISLGTVSVYTLGVFLLVALLFASYVIWREAKKEGFDENQIFDMILVVVLGAVGVGRLVYALLGSFTPFDLIKHVAFFWTPGTNSAGAVAGASVIGFLWVKGKRWSFFRIADIFALGFSISLPVLLLFKVLVRGDFRFLIASGFLVLLHALLQALRLKGFVYGGVFAVFLVGVVAVLAPFFRDAQNLLFFAILVIVGLVVLAFRLRAGKKKMVKSPITRDLLKDAKNALSRKDKELAREESLASKEDSYNVPGRDTLNTEFVDEAKEDETHETIDSVRRSISDMRFQIRKALARINIGTYGICDVCHKPIDPARLRVFPQATTCLECEEKKN